MTHLGAQVSALADGQLAPAEAEQALAHVAGCADCAAELAAARSAHRALAAAMDVPVAPELTARLLALGGCAARPSAGSSMARQPASAARLDESVPLPGAYPPGLPTGCLDGSLARRRRVPGRVLGTAAVGVGVLVAGLFTLGEQPDVVPQAHRAAALALLARAPEASSVREGWTVAPAVAGALADDGALPGSGLGPDGSAAHAHVLAWMEGQGWACPTGLPEGYRITALRLDGAGSGTLELDLLGARGTVVVTQQHGRLDTSALRGARVVQIEGRAVHLLSTAPWHGVWQSGDTVVSVVAEVPQDEVETLIAAYPDRGYDEGVQARITRGWKALAGAWNP